MSQKQQSAPARRGRAPEHLIDGDCRAGEERLIGGDTGLAAVMARARMVSRSSAPVLLFGETGTGKEIIARAIHEHSPFRERPVPPRELRRDRVRADRLGAVRPRAGRLHRRGQRGARAGSSRPTAARCSSTKSASCALAAQVRLLRVVQDGEVVRVGGERPVHVNVRIVAATHRDLPAMVETQTFREDLYYRLSVFPIVIPPLRDRPSDIRAFAEYFAERAANRFGLRPVPVSDDDVRLLDRLSLAGQRARDGGGDGSGGADRPGTRARRRGRARPASTERRAGPDARAVDEPQAAVIEPLDVVMRRHIEAALRHTHGRVDGPHGAARLLRINPHTSRADAQARREWKGFRAPRDLTSPVNVDRS